MSFKVLPFKGIHYSSQISDLSDVVTPPYDVINPELQEELYERSPYNFVRLDLAKQEGDARYQAASEALSEWLEKGVLEQDDKPAFYFHHQIFDLPDGRTITRKGFLGRRRVEDFSEGGIKPHEKTLDGPKADRLKLTRATKTNLSPVFSLYSDPQKKIDAIVNGFKQSDPILDFKTKQGERHQVWRIDDEQAIAAIGDTLENQPLFIADGHHRYETAINYRNEQRQANPPGDGDEAFNYLMMYFSNMNDDGLIILPIHRALHSLADFNIEDLVAKLKTHFEITKLDANTESESLQKVGADQHGFALVTEDPNQSYLATISKDKWLATTVAQNLSEPLKELDVSVLHRLVLEEILGIDQEAQAKQENIIYWKDTQRAFDETRKGKCQVTFLMNATPIEGMEKVALAGEKMPQKSTFFYPKILSGLVVNPLG